MSTWEEAVGGGGNNSVGQRQQGVLQFDHGCQSFGPARMAAFAEALGAWQERGWAGPWGGRFARVAAVVGANGDVGIALGGEGAAGRGGGRQWRRLGTAASRT